MKLSDNSIDRLRSSVSRLVEKSQQLEKENQRLTKLSESQKEELDILRLKLAQTQDKLNAVTLSGSIIEVSGGTKAARQRVNNLLRDVDRCISLVNK